MNQNQGFFNFDLRQPVNQWLCFALLGVMCFWVVLYYLTHKAEAFGEIYVNKVFIAPSVLDRRIP